MVESCRAREGQRRAQNRTLRYRQGRVDGGAQEAVRRRRERERERERERTARPTSTLTVLLFWAWGAEGGAGDDGAAQGPADGCVSRAGPGFY